MGSPERGSACRARLGNSLCSSSFLSSSGGPPSTRITPEFSKWASDGKHKLYIFKQKKFILSQFWSQKPEAMV